MVHSLRFFPLQNAVCFIILTYLAPVLFTFYIQGVLKLKKNNSGAKRLSNNYAFPFHTEARDILFRATHFWYTFLVRSSCYASFLFRFGVL